MTLQGTQIAAGTATWWIVAVLFIAGWIAVYLVLQHKLARAIDQLRIEMGERMNSLSLLVRKDQAPVSGAGSGAEDFKRAVPVAALKDAPARVTTAAVPAAQPADTAGPAPEVAPEVLLVIAAAVSAFLGKKVRIRSARLLQTPYELINPWAQQGRVVIQASHNLLQRSRWE